MKRFLDTNIVVYNYAEVETEKYRKASDTFLGTGRICSTQVLSELSNVLSSKFRFPWAKIRTIFRDVLSAVDVVTVSVSTIDKALTLSERYKYSYYDSLILASAIEARCSILYSEDFQHNQVIEGVQIVNHFF